MNKFGIKLSVSFLREGKTFVAYSPALDLSTCGKSLNEAKKRFNEIVKIFFEKLQKMGTTEEVLINLGWQKKQGSFLPPVMIAQELTSFNLPIQQFANA